MQAFFLLTLGATCQHLAQAPTGILESARGNAPGNHPQQIKALQGRARRMLPDEQPLGTAPFCANIFLEPQQRNKRKAWWGVYPICTKQIPDIISLSL